MSYKDYFSKAKEWSNDAYHGPHPTALYRMQILKREITDDGDIKFIVDMGCGSGQLMKAFKKHKVLGIDSSIEMIKLAGKGLWSPVEDNFLPNKAFDIAVAMGIIYYHKTDDLIFNEAYRLLKPRGLLFVSFRNINFERKPDNGPTRRLHDPSQMKEIGRKYGFKLLKIINVNESHFIVKFRKKG